MIKTLTLQEAIDEELLCENGLDANGLSIEAAWDAEWWQPGSEVESAFIDFLEHEARELGGSVIKVTSGDSYALIDSEDFWHYSGCVQASLDYLDEEEGTRRELLEVLAEKIRLAKS